MKTKTKLKKVDHNISTAKQCRKMGIKVGDTIYGFNYHNSTVGDDVKLTLVFLGKDVAVFKTLVKRLDRYGKFHRWKSLGEKSNWSLSYRDWYKLA